jgi:hypothetical protein
MHDAKYQRVTTFFTEEHRIRKAAEQSTSYGIVNDRKLLGRGVDSLQEGIDR